MELESGIAAFETKNFAHAIKLLSPIADEGNVDALYRMAIMLQNGLGCIEDTEKAHAFMLKSAESDFALAQHALGFMYFEGECVEKDIDKSIEWFTKAANQGLLGSATTLAMIYEEGKLVPQDIEKAQYWYKQAGIEKT
ncbi:MAG: hypothetical protein CMD88_05385 [Gammaproteobacteria bacterium]|nr:hypothetical protein [Gammaproteobacteria bacterium]